MEFTNATRMGAGRALRIDVSGAALDFARGRG